ncbi:MAG TPA: NAD-glutamate dehydrogenase [Rhizomicrobium sp.]|jgi:glutamate dehydrogenase|nr:NAD-glutamate dehydrogenase [Rhizomicrobium sp.]
MTANTAYAIDPADAAVVAHDDQAKATATLRDAARLLTEPGQAAFFDAFYRGAPPEDVTRYAPESLAALAALVFENSLKRKPGETLVSLFDMNAQSRDGARKETILLAVNDDMPFLFDSLLADTSAQGLRVHALFHPIMPASRDASGVRSDSGAASRESVIVLVLDPIADDARREALIKSADDVFAQVRLAVRDWRKMLLALKETVAELSANPPRISKEELGESLAFLEWLATDHFTFLGARDYAYSDANGGSLAPIDASGLGVLANIEARVVRRGGDRAQLTPEVRAFLTQPQPIIITKSNERSLVHRRVHMDYVGVKIFDRAGNLTGERRFVGLFTSGAYSRRPGDIPLLRHKVNTVTKRANLAAGSHDAKALAHILDNYPRDELFQVNEDELFATAMGVLRLGERPKVRVFLRFDRFDRFVSAVVYLPRDRYDTGAREKVHHILAKAFDGRESAATPTLDESSLARVHYIVGRHEGERPHVDVHMLEADIRDAIRTWDDGFAAALARQHGDAEGVALHHRHGEAFPARYRDAFAPDEAVCDLGEIETLAKQDGGLKARAYRRATDAHAAMRLKLYGLGNVPPLSSLLPVFENLGFRVIAEDSYPVALQSGDGWSGDASVLDFLMERADEGAADLSEIKAPFEEAFHAVVTGVAESDGLNKLVVGAGLSWRDVTILRAVAKFLRQAGFAFSQDYIEQALSRNPDIAGLLVDLFRTKSDPSLGEGRDAAIKTLQDRLAAALNDVPSLDDDRIIRRVRNVIDCTLRTNFFQTDAAGAAKPYLAIKLDSQKLEELPSPRPHVEIFVYAPMVEGVHLRFGKIARGGIRWSDRREDFRTEVLGLVKAQQVKNAVIVPVGSKGGFYPKRLPVNATRDEVMASGIAAYKCFINALLDLTDNLHTDGSVVPPKDVVRHDGDDPYLVVAADKGTATFSDIANAIAIEHGFWLGDAFASGGSHGYDHKKMGITARGAWEAVKRHFRELGRDIQNEPFTVAGVGDMSGDVFGNGMLLSKCTKLVAAFDHRHIFIDPDPDLAKSFAERQRMFDLPRSSWADYDKSLISKGGGVFARNVKEIPLSEEMKALTGLAKDRAAPADIMKALIKADVDLLWFGGIGTYVKAASQSNADAGDRANDAIRANGAELRAKVVGEGANLGATQLGRIEYALKGGRINTDAIDNSAGVDTSDHEVNLKILLSGPLRRGELSEDQRDALLGEMTDDVAAHVLRDNYEQTLAISVAQSRGVMDMDSQGRFIRDLERRGKLDRAVEFLPSDEELRKRAQENKGLTRPELAVLLAYAKLDLDAEIAASGLPEESYFTSELAGYFPKAAVARFPDELSQHRLKREIVATVLANKIVNLAGPVFVHRMKEVSSAAASRVARAYVVAEGAFGLSALKARIDLLDGKVPAAIQTGMYADVAELLRRLGLWFLVNVPATADLGETVARYRAGVEALRGTYSSLVSPYEMTDTVSHIDKMEEAGVPHDLADDVAALQLWSTAPEIAQLAYARSLDIDLVAGAYFAVGAIIGLDRLRGFASRINANEHWDRLAIRRIVDDLYAGQRALTAQVLAGFEGDKMDRTRADGAKAADAWAEQRADMLARTKSFLEELERTGDLSIAKLTLANSQIHELASAG